MIRRETSGILSGSPTISIGMCLAHHSEQEPAFSERDGIERDQQHDAISNRDPGVDFFRRSAGLVPGSGDHHRRVCDIPGPERITAHE